MDITVWEEFSWIDKLKDIREGCVYVARERGDLKNVLIIMSVNKESIDVIFNGKYQCQY